MSDFEKAARMALEAISQFIGKELTVGQRYTNEGQQLLDAEFTLRQALSNSVEQPAQHDYRTKYDRPCYKCRSHFCPGNCKEPEHLQQPAQQEPVAWPEHEFIQWGAAKYGPLLRAAIDLLAEVENNLDAKDAPQKFGVPFGKLIALRAAIETSPQASKPWVGLTDEEMHDCWDSPLTPLGMKHVRKVEAKLREKNT